MHSNKLQALRQRFRNWWYAPAVLTVGFAQIIFILLWGLHANGGLQTLELNVYDHLLRSRAAVYPPEQRVTIVWFNDADQRRWHAPLPDDTLAEVLTRIFRHRPRAVGLDIYRDLPVPKEKGAGYERLVEILTSHPNLIAITKVSDTKGARVDPPPALKGTDQIGFNDVLADAHGIIRRGLLFMGDPEGNTHPYFGLLLAAEYLKQDRIAIGGDEAGNLRLGETSLVRLSQHFGGYRNLDARGYQFLSGYPGVPAEFPHTTVSQVLDGEFDPALFEDKIVIFGVDAEATPDFFFTPIHFARVPGAAVHAFNVSQLLRIAYGEYRPLQSWSETWEILWLWGWCVGAALLGLVTLSLGRLILALSGGLGVLAAILSAAFSAGWWLPGAGPALAWGSALVVVTAWLSYRRHRERSQLMQLFSKHVSREVAEVIWAERDQYLNMGRLNSQRLTATVLFTDLQNFTSLSEHLEPRVLMDWLNEYMEAMVGVVERHHGQVNKFIGDALMAGFGIPVPRTTREAVARDALSAVECALDMRAELERLSPQWEERGLPWMRMRVGIFTGPLVAGCLGSSDRQEYTIIGDTVNTASRLESFDKNVGAEQTCRILISQATIDYLPPERFVLKCIGQVHLKGKRDPLVVYSVEGFKQTDTPATA